MATIIPNPLPVTEADGANTTLGAQADAAITNPASTGTISAFIKGIISTMIGGTAKSINRGGAKGTTTAADVTSTASGANHNPLDVIPYDSAGNPNPAIVLGAGAAKIGITTTDQTTHGTTDLVAADITKVGGTAIALGPAQPSAGILTTLPNDVQVNGTGLSAINTDLLSGTVSGWYDAALFHYMTVTIIANASVTGGVVTFEQTNDITNAPSGGVLNVWNSVTAPGAAPITTVTLTASLIGQYEAPLPARYFRIRISTGVTGAGGTVQVTATFSQVPPGVLRLGVNQSTASNLNTTAVGMGSVVTNSTINYRTLSLVATGQVVKSSVGRLYAVQVGNSNASAVYLKIYNKATTPTVGTDTPIFTYYIPATSNQQVNIDIGSFWSSGIGIAATANQADSDATAPAANTVSLNAVYA